MTRRLNRLTLVALACGVLLSGAQADTGASFALRAKRVIPCGERGAAAIDRGIVIVRDGKIAAVGADLAIPRDLRLIDMPDAVVCPGFVDAGSDLVPPHAGLESVSGAYRAIDGFDPYADYRPMLATGVTTVSIDPGAHRLISGRAAVVRLGGPRDSRVLAPDGAITINLGVFGTAEIVDVPFFASSDEMIQPGQRQRPSSRLSALAEAQEQIGRAAMGLPRDRTDLHELAFAEAWRSQAPVRVQAREAVDIEGAMRLLRGQRRSAYLVGLNDAHELADELIASGLPAVLSLESSYRWPGPTLGPGEDVVGDGEESAGALAQANGEKTLIALTGRGQGPLADLRMIAALAMRGGMPRELALQAITTAPAKILGVADRVGAIEQGLDADLLILSGDPLDLNARVLRTYVAGELAYEAPRADAIVVRAGHVWTGDQMLRDAQVLIEDGKVAAVGARVSHPRHARIIDAGPDAFVTPGFIDAHGHLGFEGDRGAAGPDAPNHLLASVANREFHRVARSGVTTVMQTSYSPNSNGSRIAAIKTWGATPERLVAQDLAGMYFTMSGQEPSQGANKIKQVLEAGKKYEQEWTKYYDELRKWKKAQAEGKKVEIKPEKPKDEKIEKVDPITGLWEYTISGDPLPEPVTGPMTLELDGANITGKLSDPMGEEEVDVNGTLNGTTVRLEIDAETDLGKPVITAELDVEDHMKGTAGLGDMFSFQFEATRTERGKVQVTLRRGRGSRGKDGKPLRPKVNEALEPIRTLLKGEIVALVAADTPAEIEAALKLLVDEYKIPVVLLDATEAAMAVDEIQKRGEQIGVVVPTRVERMRDDRPYAQAVDLARQGVRIAMQSHGEDGARSLPNMAMFAVSLGLGGDAALRALTVDAARMFKVEDHVGRLAPGCDGDVLIFSGHPFDGDAQLERVIVGGSEVPDRFEEIVE